MRKLLFFIGLIILNQIGVPRIHADQLKKLKVTTSFLPVYIFTANVVGDRKGVEVDCLLSGNVGPHDYQMRPSDMKRLAEADIIIMNGLGALGFIEFNLKYGRPESGILASAAGLPLIEVPEEPAGSSYSQDRPMAINPHTWVSPKMAALQVKNIAEFLSRIDPDGEAEYTYNAALYIERLERLHEEYVQTVKGFSKRKIITLHNAFNYLARDTGLIIAGVVYETPGEETSAGKIAGLIEMMKREGISVIFADPQFPQRTADILARATGAKVYTLDPVATGEFRKSYYEDVMKKNLEILKKVFQSRKTFPHP